MKYFLLILFMGIAGGTLVAQQSVGIGTATPNNSAVLDLTSTSKGLLIPRMTGAQRTAIVTPATGLMVYQTNTVASPASVPGFYLYDGAAWKMVAKTEDIPAASSYWLHSGTRDYLYNNSDSVGIGTSTPDQKLHINSGKIYLQDNRAGQSPHVIFDVPAGTNLKEGGLQFRRSGDTLAALNYVENTSFANYIRIGLSNAGKSTDLTINTNGEIGIGTHNPSGKLHISTYDGDNVLINDSDGMIQFAKPIIGGFEKKAFVQLSDQDDLRLGTNSANNTGRIVMRTNGSDQVTVDAAGDVGIGVPFALTKLQIDNGQDAGITANDNGYVMLGNISGTNLLIDNNEIMVRSGLTTPSTLTIQNDGGDLRVGSNNRLFVDDNGNVGIGTGAPAGKLHITGRTYINNGSGEALAIAGTNPFIQFYHNNNSYGFIQQAGTDLFMGVNGGRLHLDGTQVAIGGVVAAASAYKLTVTGKVICEEVKVKLSGNWPDYVFGPNHKMRTLEELEGFINTNKHLPNIPAAADIEQNGLEVGDMQKRMMEKIEELTLYIIGLKKEIDELKKANNK
jgi:hypothetical protein